MMWTPQGDPLYNMTDFMEYLFTRFKDGQRDSPVIIVSLIKYKDPRAEEEEGGSP